jgi:competence protein ComEC
MCDNLGCIVRISGVIVAIEKQPLALLDDCQAADLVISRTPIRTSCPSAQFTIDRFDLWREGAHAVWISEAGEIRIQSVTSERGDRPWVVRPDGN